MTRTLIAAADGREAIKNALDVAVIDYSLPLLNGIEATRQILKRGPRTEVLIFTMHDEETPQMYAPGARQRKYDSNRSRRAQGGAQVVLNGDGLRLQQLAVG